MASSSPELPRCDTELSLGSPAPGELPRGGGGGLTATELQAMAILRVARRAAAAEEEEAAPVDGGAAGLKVRRSMERFLQRRREARRLSLRGVADAAASPSPSSSSSFSCLTDSSRI